MRLLAVDDDPVILDLLPVVFREADLPHLTLANSGRSALDLLTDPDTHFDCLLLDIMMDEMTGIELCARIRQMPQYRHTPILMLTSVKNHAEIEAAFAAGANDYITKPFDVKEVATRIRVAERMAETTSHVPRLDPLDLMAETEPGRHSFSLDDPIMLETCDRLILPFSLGNYLSQLSRSRLDTCIIFAVRISDIGALYAKSQSHEFAIALAEVVDAVSHVVNNPNLLMSYEGDGTFLCIIQGAEPPSWPEIEDEVHAQLHKGGAVFDDGTPMDLTLAIGNPIAPNASRNQRVKKTFDRAIDRALMREKSKGRTLGGSAAAARVARSRLVRAARY